MVGISAVPSYDELLTDVRAVRSSGAGKLRELRLSALRRASVLMDFGGADSTEPAPINRLLRDAVARFEDEHLQAAANYTLGLIRGTGHWTLTGRRERAAGELRISGDTFRKKPEQDLLAQVVEQILELLHEQALFTAPPNSGPDPAPRRTRIYGRASEISEWASVLMTLHSSGALAAILLHGPGGSGKTQAAIHLASEVANSTGTSVHYVDLRSYAAGIQALEASDAARALLVAEGVSALEISLDSTAAVYQWRTRAQRSRNVIVLDNVESVAQLAELLVDESPAFYIVTSRQAISAVKHRYVPRPLSTLAITTITAEALGRSESDVEAEALSLAELSGGRPFLLQRLLTLVQAGGAPPRQILAQLGAEPSALHAEAAYDDLTAQTLKHLDEVSATAYRALWIGANTTFTAGAVAALIGVSEKRAFPALLSLERHNLLQRSDLYTFYLHDIDRAMIEASAQQDDEDLRVSCARLLQYWVQRHATHPADHASTDQLLRSVKFVAKRSSEADWLMRPLELLNDIAADRGFGAQYFDLCNVLSDHESAAVRDLAAVGKASVMWSTGDYSTVHRIAATAISTQRNRARLSLIDAFAYEREGNYPEATRLLDAIPQQQQIHLRSKIDRIRGAVAFRREDYSTAIDFFISARSSLLTAEFTPDLCAVLNNIGFTLRAMGWYQDALEWLWQANSEAAKYGDVGTALTIRVNTAWTLLSVGEVGYAEHSSSEAAARAARLGIRYERARALSVLSECYERQGRDADAKQAHRDSQFIFVQIATSEASAK